MRLYRLREFQIWMCLAGSNYDSGHFKSCLTSYDYDAPISEAGDLTTKYNLLKNVIKKVLTYTWLYMSDIYAHTHIYIYIYYI